MFINVKFIICCVDFEVLNGCQLFKVVYVVLEFQYQSVLLVVVRNINCINFSLVIQLMGYLIEELWDLENYVNFKYDVSEVNFFIVFLIFIEDLVDKVVEVVIFYWDNLDVAIVFFFMFQVMCLNKMGFFFMV